MESLERKEKGKKISMELIMREKLSNMRLASIQHAIAVALFILGVSSTNLVAEIIIPFIPADKVTVNVDSDVTFDPASSLYTYVYELTSAVTSEQDVSFFAVEFSGEVKNIVSPAGWSGSVHDDRPVVSWSATDVGVIPPDYVDDGNTLPSPYEINPGSSLGGFSFQSQDPPSDAVAYVQGYTPLPQVTDHEDEELLLDDLPADFTENSFVGSTVSPKVLIAGDVFLGGRRPGVDGFIGFLSITDGETRSSPLAVIIRFGVNDETVDISTFSATLNTIDVTDMFVPNGNLDELLAIFDFGSSPLMLDRNVLLTTVDGLVPDTDGTASDVDRLTFFVE
jgi:hypothetical protein